MLPLTATPSPLCEILKRSMNRNIILFNLVYYLVVVLLFLQGKKDPSSSLGIGFLIVGFWSVAIIALLFLMSKKIIVPRTVLDKIGIIAATPVPSLIAVGILAAL